MTQEEVSKLRAELAKEKEGRLAWWMEAMEWRRRYAEEYWAIRDWEYVNGGKDVEEVKRLLRKT